MAKTAKSKMNRKQYKEYKTKLIEATSNQNMNNNALKDKFRKKIVMEKNVKYLNYVIDEKLTLSPKVKVKRISTPKTTKTEANIHKQMIRRIKNATPSTQLRRINAQIPSNVKKSKSAIYTTQKERLKQVQTIELEKEEELNKIMKEETESKKN